MFNWLPLILRNFHLSFSRNSIPPESEMVNRKTTTMQQQLPCGHWVDQRAPNDNRQKLRTHVMTSLPFAPNFTMMSPTLNDNYLQKGFIGRTVHKKIEYILVGNGPYVICGKTSTLHIDNQCDKCCKCIESNAFTETFIFFSSPRCVSGMIPSNPDVGYEVFFGGNCLAIVDRSRLIDGTEVCQDSIAVLRDNIQGGHFIGKNKIEIYFYNCIVAQYEIVNDDNSLSLKRGGSIRFPNIGKITAVCSSSLAFGTSGGFVYQFDKELNEYNVLAHLNSFEYKHMKRNKNEKNKCHCSICTPQLCKTDATFTHTGYEFEVYSSTILAIEMVASYLVLFLTPRFIGQLNTRTGFQNHIDGFFTCMCYKENTVFTGDREGNVFSYDLIVGVGSQITLTRSESFNMFSSSIVSIFPLTAHSMVAASVTGELKSFGWSSVQHPDGDLFLENNGDSLWCSDSKIAFYRISGGQLFRRVLGGNDRMVTKCVLKSDHSQERVKRVFTIFYDALLITYANSGFKYFIEIVNMMEYARRGTFSGQFAFKKPDNCDREFLRAFIIIAPSAVLAQHNSEVLIYLFDTDNDCVKRCCDFSITEKITAATVVVSETERLLTFIIGCENGNIYSVRVEEDTKTRVVRPVVRAVPASVLMRGQRVVAAVKCFSKEFMRNVGYMISAKGIILVFTLDFTLGKDNKSEGTGQLCVVGYMNVSPALGTRVVQMFFSYGTVFAAGICGKELVIWDVHQRVTVANYKVFNSNDCWYLTVDLLGNIMLNYSTRFFFRGNPSPQQKLFLMPKPVPVLLPLSTCNLNTTSCAAAVDKMPDNLLLFNGQAEDCMTKAGAIIFLGDFFGNYNVLTYGFTAASKTRSKPMTFPCQTFFRAASPIRCISPATFLPNAAHQNLTVAVGCDKHLYILSHIFAEFVTGAVRIRSVQEFKKAPIRHIVWLDTFEKVPDSRKNGASEVAKIALFFNDGKIKIYQLFSTYSLFCSNMVNFDVNIVIHQTFEDCEPSSFIWASMLKPSANFPMIVVGYTTDGYFRSIKMKDHGKAKKSASPFEESDLVVLTSNADEFSTLEMQNLCLPFNSSCTAVAAGMGDGSVLIYIHGENPHSISGCIFGNLDRLHSDTVVGLGIRKIAVAQYIVLIVASIDVTGKIVIRRMPTDRTGIEIDRIPLILYTAVRKPKKLFVFDGYIVIFGTGYQILSYK